MLEVIEVRFRPLVATVGEGRPFEKLAADADLGAVRRPASRWDRLVLGVGAPLSISVGDLAVSNDSGLMFWPPRREARAEGMPKEGCDIWAIPPASITTCDDNDVSGESVSAPAELWT